MRKSRKREIVSSKRTRSFSPMVGSFQVRGAGVVKDMPDTGEKLRGDPEVETPVAAPALLGESAG